MVKRAKHAAHAAPKKLGFRQAVKRPSVSGKPSAQAKPSIAAQSAASGKPVKARPSVAAKASGATAHAKERPSVAAKPTKKQRAKTSGAPKSAALEKSLAAQHDDVAQTETESLSTTEKSAKAKPTKSKKKPANRKRRVAVIALVVVVITAVFSGLLIWNQWFRYDDHADIQGTWQVANSDAAIVITDSQIQLTSDVAYDYTLDTFNKTVTFSFGGASGSARYVFSPERTQLTMTEVDASDASQTIDTKLEKRFNADGSAVYQEVQNDQ